MGTATVLVGGAIGLGLALFGVAMLVTGRVPAATGRAFRDTRDAALYHLFFGAALVILAVGISMAGGGILAALAAVIAVALVGLAVVKHRPRAGSAS